MSDGVSVSCAKGDLSIGVSSAGSAESEGLPVRMSHSVPQAGMPRGMWRRAGMSCSVPQASGAVWGIMPFLPSALSKAGGSVRMRADQAGVSA